MEEITPIGLGCKNFDSLSNSAVREVVRASLANGVNWFDTAKWYGNGASERALAKALFTLGVKQDDVFIATKWFPVFRTASNITRTIGKRLSALHPYPIDLYQIHNPYGLSSKKEEMKAMAQLVRAKKIRYVGVSNFSADQMYCACKALNEEGIGLFSNQVEYSLLNRKIESNGVLDTARGLDIKIIAYSPLAMGVLTGRFHRPPKLLNDAGMRVYSEHFKPQGIERSRPLVDNVCRMAKRLGVTPSQVALNWLVCKDVKVVVGASSPQQAKENAGTMRGIPEQDDIDLLNGISEQYK